MTMYTDEHAAFRAAVRGLLEKSASSSAVRAVIDGPDPYDRTLWHRLTTEVGLTGLAVGEDDGGSGIDLVALAVALEEAGRANLPAPLLSTTLAAFILESAGPGPWREELPALAHGERVAAVHLEAPGTESGTGPVRIQDGKASGTLSYLVDGDAADLAVIAGPEGGLLVDLREPGVRRAPLHTMDLTRGQARIVLDDAPVRPIHPADPTDWHTRAVAYAAVLAAAEQIGGAERCLEMSASYASQRYQYGRAIGSFQAVKHLCANMLIELELARSVYWNALALAAGLHGDVARDELTDAAAAAKLACSQAFTQITSDTIRVHGGIGFTWEHDAHLYFRRARATARLFGTADAYADQLAAHAGLGAAPRPQLP
ncbi:acyl-CoA dehydrogenase family protein [Streptomyces sp. NPDC046805]|uniref:acyl-CoA dehydrogenase family protein n=1 Tax=Streptomyces sp. NPDC046805 TaxID=3155134 RepID=UPI0033C63048